MKIAPELKLADSRSRHNEEMYRQLFENSMDAVLQTMPTGEILAANPAACALFSLTEQEIIERGRAGLVDSSDARMNELLGLRDRSGSARGEMRMRRGDGSLFDAEISSSSYLNQQGEKLASILIRDITERKQTQEALAASESQLHNLMLNLRVGIVVHGPDTTILRHNKTALSLLGLSDEQMLGKVAQDQAWRFVRGNGTPMSLAEYPVMRVIATRDPVHDLVLGIIRSFTDDCAWVLINAFPEFTANGQWRC